jgi:molybdopterin-guanine dinucleotide biosynthesis protein
MGLTITRGTPEPERTTHMHAEIRVYRTTDGTLVGEGDPRGAFLAYVPGVDVADQDADAYRVLRESKSLGTLAQVDDVARDEMRMRQAGDPSAVARPGERPALIHDRLATELADEARALANVADQGAVADVRADMHETPIATERLGRTESGELVKFTDPHAVTLAYTEGMKIGDSDVDQFDALYRPERSSADPNPDPVDDGSDPDPAKSADPPANKMSNPPANKSATTTRSRTAGK